MGDGKFYFKQFALYNQQSPHKVGTDGVLLGCWAGLGAQPKRIIDVGSGTGLIGMMLAQRFPHAQIYLLEKEPSALEECSQSLKAFPWKERITLVDADVLHWQAPFAFDLVVSNPPYFLQSLPSLEKGRRLARHTEASSFNAWMKRLQEWLAPQGRLSLVLPLSLEAPRFALPLIRKCLVQDSPLRVAKRQLLEYCMEDALIKEEQITLKEQDGKWSASYLQWVAPFLKLPI